LQETISYSCITFVKFSRTAALCENACSIGRPGPLNKQMLHSARMRLIENCVGCRSHHKQLPVRFLEGLMLSVKAFGRCVAFPNVDGGFGGFELLPDEKINRGLLRFWALQQLSHGCYGACREFGGSPR